MSGTTNKHTLQLLNELNELKKKQLQMKRQQSKNLSTRRKSSTQSFLFQNASKHHDEYAEYAEYDDYTDYDANNNYNDYSKLLQKDGSEYRKLTRNEIHNENQNAHRAVYAMEQDKQRANKSNVQYSNKNLQRKQSKHSLHSVSSTSKSQFSGNNDNGILSRDSSVSKTKMYHVASKKQLNREQMNAYNPFVPQANHQHKQGGTNILVDSRSTSRNVLLEEANHTKKSLLKPARRSSVSYDSSRSGVKRKTNDELYDIHDTTHTTIKSSTGVKKSKPVRSTTAQRSLKRSDSTSTLHQKTSSNVLLSKEFNRNVFDFNELPVYRPTSARSSLSFTPGDAQTPAETDGISHRRRSEGTLAQVGTSKNRPASAQRRVDLSHRANSHQYANERPGGKIKERPQRKLRSVDNALDSNILPQSSNHHTKIQSHYSFVNTENKPQYSHFDPSSLISKKQARRMSINIEEKANEIIRDTDEKIRLEHGREVSPTHGRSSRTLLFQSSRSNSKQSLPPTEQPLRRHQSMDNLVYNSTLNELEQHEQKLESEIQKLDQQLAGLTPKAKRLNVQRPRSAVPLGSRKDRRIVTDSWSDFEGEGLKNKNLDIELQIEKHKQRLQNSVKKKSSAIFRNRSVDLSKNRSSIHVSRIQELSKPKIRKSIWEMDPPSTEARETRRRESQSVPRMRPHSATKLFQNDSNIKKTPQVHVHLKHLLIGEQEIQRIQNEIRSQDESEKKQQVERNDHTSRIHNSPQWNADRMNGFSTNPFFPTIYESTPRRKSHHFQLPINHESVNAFDTLQQYTINDNRRNSAPAVQEETKSSLQHLVEQKLKALQETMQKITRVESKYQKDVEEITNNLNNSLRQSGNFSSAIREMHAEESSKNQPARQDENYQAHKQSFAQSYRFSQPIEEQYQVKRQENSQKQTHKANATNTHDITTSSSIHEEIHASDYLFQHRADVATRNTIHKLSKRIKDFPPPQVNNRQNSRNPGVDSLEDQELRKQRGSLQRSDSLKDVHQTATSYQHVQHQTSEQTHEPSPPQKLQSYQQKNPLLQQNLDTFNPLLSPSQENEKFDPFTEKRPLQRNTPLFDELVGTPVRSRLPATNPFAELILNRQMEQEDSQSYDDFEEELKKFSQAQNLKFDS